MSDALADYLYDHLCGAMISIEVLHTLQEKQKGKPLGDIVVPVLSHAEAERQVLLLMSETLGIDLSSVREHRWVAENAALIKRGIDVDGQSGLTVAMQYIAMLTGSRVSFWKLLELAADQDGRLVGYDFKQLSAQAQMQHDAIKQQLVELTTIPSLGQYTIARALRQFLKLIRWFSFGLGSFWYHWKWLSKPTASSAKMARFAVLILVGPSERNLQDLYDLIESTLCYEAGMHWLVMIDDCEINRELAKRVVTPITCSKVSIHNPRNSLGDPRLGGQCSGLLAGLLWLFEHAVPDFVLKIDTDALVIAPFAIKLHAFIEERSSAGVIGTLGHTSNRSSALFRCQLYLPSPLISGYVARFGHLPGQASNTYARNLIKSGLDTTHLLWPKRIWSDVELSYSNGYLGLHYCQGGSYAISAKMLTRLGEGGFLSNGSEWASVPVGEDVMIGMYARAVGLDICDYSDSGQVFGVQFHALPHPPDELVLRGFSIIHSVRNNPHWSEDQVRQFFRSIRTR